MGSGRGSGVRKGISGAGDEALDVGFDLILRGQVVGGEAGGLNLDDPVAANVEGLREVVDATIRGGDLSVWEEDGIANIETLGNLSDLIIGSVVLVDT